MLAVFFGEAVVFVFLGEVLQYVAEVVDFEAFRVGPDREAVALGVEAAAPDGVGVLDDLFELEAFDVVVVVVVAVFHVVLLLVEV